MKREDRQKAIMDLLVTQGEVEVDKLSEQFVVSKMTIHRDLDDLEAEGMIRKIRGGATIESGTRFESDFRYRERQSQGAKMAMAEAALNLIDPGMTVMVNDGSMAAFLGKYLPRKRPLTVITNNAAILDSLRAESGIKMISLGGSYSSKFNAYFGSLTETCLANLRADISFISTPAISGLEVFHMDDVVVKSKRAMMRSGTKCCLLVNHARFDHTALHKLADLEEFDHIITDTAPSAGALSAIEGAGLSLTIADAANREGA
ncbi:DeoR/GlpR family DNA-binding transcription regulator [Cohaesibacter marisflavi]|uniref:DeoR/GlpR family DNA-binding transcription regulator n=1 Tax=Cohaesibacter marisflavi TaxID=655353 RepID=UPI0029C80492|nr:DeoR/GlpR family DNA-binding transcription regulator [Cohaesibacter marisflavi]